MRNEREAHTAMSARPDVGRNVDRRDSLGMWRVVVWTAVAWVIGIGLYWATRSWS
jgi:fatty acid desaturase